MNSVSLRGLLRFSRSNVHIRPFSVNSVSLGPVDSAGSVDEREIASFSRLASSWWDENGPLKALHSMNQLRIPWIRDTLVTHGPVKPSLINEVQPLTGVSLVDVGCGGGILSEPLAKLGANVLGIDASTECIHVAEERLSQQSARKSTTGGLRFKNCSSEELALSEAGKFNAVVASEILEHVNHRQEFLHACIDLLKPGGIIFLTTLNATYIAKILGITVAENILNLVPPGTHEYEKFTAPDDLQFMLQQEGCSVRLVHGMCYNPLTNRWSWASRSDINYAMWAVKDS